MMGPKQLPDMGLAAPHGTAIHGATEPQNTMEGQRVILTRSGRLAAHAADTGTTAALMWIERNSFSVFHVCQGFTDGHINPL